MNQVDDAILEFLADVSDGTDDPVVFSPMDVWINVVQLRGLVDRAPNTVSLRLGKLEKRDLVAMPDHSGTHYYLTDKGQQYLSGDLERSELLD
jgi:hypothetical protein